MDRMNELAFYTLGGAPRTPRELIAEVQQAEAHAPPDGHSGLRHDDAQADRGALLTGLGPGHRADAQCLWAAAHHDGPDRGLRRSHAPRLARRSRRRTRRTGWKYPLLTMGPQHHEHIPMTFTAFGPNSLALGGRAFDAVVLHTFFTDETTARCVAAVKRAAEQAGREPAAVRVWSCFATVGDHLPEDLRLKKFVGRMATYLQAYGDLMVQTNRWDPAVLQRFREDAFVAGFRGAIDALATTEQLEHVATLIPDEWLAPAATGSPEACVEKIRGQFDLGCDGVILHGATPAELEPILAAYRKTRPAGRFDHLAANPAG